ncbi:MAG: HupE/UreJ family protein [Gammaproteobacteria bacterium]|nr:HupE/UreJ family protein [Gammaproteobacteria bacterium]
MKKDLMRIVAAISVFFIPGLAVAHTGSHEVSGLISGILHPLTGLDHLIVILAIGLWLGARVGSQVPLMMAVFLAFLGLGAVMGASGFVLPSLETGIAVSVLVAGLLVATLARLPVIVSASLLALFALFHGTAHGAEMPVAITPLLYGAGLLISTVVLQLGAVWFGRMAQSVRAEWLLRMAGVLGGVFGAWLLLSV